MTRRSFLLGTAGLLLGCVSDAARYDSLEPPPAGRALLYVYRNDRYIGNTSRVVPKIRINRDVVGPLLFGGFLRLTLEPGAVEVAIFDFDWSDDHARVGSASAVVNLTLVADSTHFVEFSLDRIGYRFGPRPANFAARALPGLHLLN